MIIVNDANLKEMKEGFGSIFHNSSFDVVFEGVEIRGGGGC